MYKKFTLIDESTRRDHHYLESNDYCTFLGEYTATKGFSHSATNQLIWDLKVDVNNTNQLKYKNRGIRRVANALQQTIPNPHELTFVPIPPSKHKSDPLYDDRMIRILTEYKQASPLVDFQELVIQNQSTRSSHKNYGNRLPPEELIELYSIDEELTQSIRQSIVIFDDMLTTGSHFKAMQSILLNRFPQHRIGGLFVSRRVFWADDPEIVFDL